MQSWLLQSDNTQFQAFTCIFAVFKCRIYESWSSIRRITTKNHTSLTHFKMFEQLEKYFDTEYHKENQWFLIISKASWIMKCYTKKSLIKHSNYFETNEFRNEWNIYSSCPKLLKMSNFFENSFIKEQHNHTTYIP